MPLPTTSSERIWTNHIPLPSWTLAVPLISRIQCRTSRYMRASVHNKHLLMFGTPLIALWLGAKGGAIRAAHFTLTWHSGKPGMASPSSAEQRMGPSRSKCRSARRFTTTFETSSIVAKLLYKEEQGREQQLLLLPNIPKTPLHTWLQVTDNAVGLQKEVASGLLCTSIWREEDELAVSSIIF